jgi:hypothetical protein
MSVVGDYWASKVRLWVMNDEGLYAAFCDVAHDLSLSHQGAAERFEEGTLVPLLEGPAVGLVGDLLPSGREWEIHAMLLDLIAEEREYLLQDRAADEQVL